MENKRKLLFSFHPQSVSGCAISGRTDARAATVANLKVDYIDQVGRFIVVERESSSSILNGKSCKSQI